MKADKTTVRPVRHWPFAAGLLGLILAILFFRSFLPGFVHFSNDGPLGQQQATWGQLPQAVTGSWDDLNYIGVSAGAFSPTITALIKLVMGPVGLSKFYAPMALFILGFGAWTFFNQLKLSRTAAVLGALGVALNSAFFSTACWGVASQQIAYGFDFMALALVVSVRPEMPLPIRAARIILAGLAVGMNVMEAADIGALMSTFVATFVFYHAVLATKGEAGIKILRGIGRVGMIAVSAAFIAAFALANLIGTQIQGVAGTQQDEATKRAHWDFATQWSFPKRDLLTLIIPGIFGYRMSDPQPVESVYWGASGRDPSWWRYFEDKLNAGDSVAFNFQNAPQPVAIKIQPDGHLTLPGIGAVKAAGLTRFELQKQISEGYSASPQVEPKASVETGQGFMRQSGGGCYMGVTVVLIVLWVVFQSLRKNSVFMVNERRLIWFWVAALVVSVPLAFGRYAPFFWYVYQIPYVSTIRNPGKFLAIFFFSMTVLAAYGVHGLCRGYLETSLSNVGGLGARLKNWWAKAPMFDKRWTVGCLLAIGASLTGWMFYASSQHSLEQYLTEVGFDENSAPGIAAFSIRQVGWYILFLSLGVGLITLILSGAFAGRRAKAGGILLGILIVVDLGRANLPWRKYVDYKEKYATNQIIEKLREKPYEQRVAILPFRAPPEYDLFQGPSGMYRIEWAQHHFPYYNIQSLDIIQMPRVPEDLAAFEGALVGDGTSNTVYRVCRRWELTNTRYLLGAAAFLNVLNQQLDPVKHRFRIATSFDIARKLGVDAAARLEQLTAVVNPSGNGQYALFEFTGALPRAKLYSQWQVNTNDQATLKLLGSEAFDPEQTVLVAGGVPPAVSGTNGNSGTVEFASYAPKDIKLKTKSDAAGVLLLNDKYDPNWQVWVDGRQAELLRCNFLMRGVHLPAGTHTVEFLFKPDVRTLYVSLAAIAFGVLLLGVVVFHAKSRRP
jgi:hypothetical protein